MTVVTCKDVRKFPGLQRYMMYVMYMRVILKTPPQKLVKFVTVLWISRFCQTVKRPSQ